MELKKIEITQEMLELALFCCLESEPADHYPCKDCYLYPLRGDDDDCMPDGTMCSKRLALDAIAFIRRINDFDKSQSKIMLEKLEQERAEKATLKKALLLMGNDLADWMGNGTGEFWAKDYTEDAQKEEDAL